MADEGDQVGAAVATAQTKIISQVCLVYIIVVYMSRLGTSVALPFAIFHRLRVSEAGTGWIPLGFGIAVKDKPSELSCS